MDKGILSDREKAMEANYFRQQDAVLIERLRQQSTFDEIAAAVADKLKVDNPDFAPASSAFGVAAETASAFLLAPLVQVAAAAIPSAVKNSRRSSVVARERGVEDGTPAQAQLLKWLEVRPDDEPRNVRGSDQVRPHRAAALRTGRADQADRRCLSRCGKASGSKISWVLGLFDGINSSEASILDTITKKLRRPA